MNVKKVNRVFNHFRADLHVISERVKDGQTLAIVYKLIQDMEIFSIKITDYVRQVELRQAADIPSVSPSRDRTDWGRSAVEKSEAHDSDG
jgi:hypothetical protein